MQSLFLIVVICTSLVSSDFSEHTEYQEIVRNRNLEDNAFTNAEEYTGPGEVKCYGQMSASVSKWITGTGMASCRPITTLGAPQGYIAEAYADNSHWVIVDDKGTADCEGEITYTTGDLGLNYCSFDNPQSLR